MQVFSALKIVDKRREKNVSGYAIVIARTCRENIWVVAKGRGKKP